LTIDINPEIITTVTGELNQGTMEGEQDVTWRCGAEKRRGGIATTPAEKREERIVCWTSG